MVHTKKKTKIFFFLSKTVHPFPAMIDSREAEEAGRKRRKTGEGRGSKE